MVTIARQCPCCGRVTEKNFPSVDIKRYASLRNKVCIQDILPHWTPDQREFLKTGFCDECMKFIFDGEEE